MRKDCLFITVQIWSDATDELVYSSDGKERHFIDVQDTQELHLMGSDGPKQVMQKLKAK
jgi:hypothetical protein